MQFSLRIINQRKIIPKMFAKLYFVVSKSDNIVQRRYKNLVS